VLGDINGELVQTYRVLKRDPAGVWSYLRDLSDKRRLYYRVRSVDPAVLSATQRAARFLFLNRHCFNGLYRTNLAGQFNVPRGLRPSSELNLAHLMRTAQLLRRCELVHGDFSETLKRGGRGDFAYIDPPYVTSRPIEPGQYGPQSLTPDDIARLASSINAFHARGGHFLLSYVSYAPLTEAIPAISRTRVRVLRSIAGRTGDRRGRYEILVSNY
jgi:DNA adenine methylase